MNSQFENTVFLSHNSADKPAVEQIQRRLESYVPPFRCWVDKDDLRSRGTWMGQIELVLAECQAAVWFVGPSGSGRIHELERQKLVDRASGQRDSFWFVPVLLPGAKKTDVIGFTSLFNWVDFSDGLDGLAPLERLARLLRGEAPRLTTADDELPADLEPYRGLERFDNEHAGSFFGRDREIQELCARMRHWPFVTVIGGSGSGKSSLVRAGLHTKLAFQELPSLSDAVRITLLPGANPFRALANQVTAAVPKKDGQAPEDLADTFEKRFRDRADGLGTVLTSRFPGDNQFILLIVDQFEELFTHCQDTPEAPGRCRDQTRQFVDLLDAVASSGVDRLRIVITLRADFYDRCLQVARLKVLVPNRQVPLGELAPEALVEVIRNPAQQAGAYFEKGLVARILADVEGQHGSLPLLQQALKELWANRSGRWLTNEGYDKSGGVAGALRKRADGTVNRLTEKQRDIAKSIFLRLITLGEGVSDTRRRVRLTELYPADEGKHRAFHEIIDRLRGKEARLIVTNEDGTVEVTHEALIQRWDKLKEWLQTNRDEIRLRHRLANAAREWADAKPEDKVDYLYAGARLAACREYAQAHGDTLNQVEFDFLRASEKVEIGRTVARMKRQTDAEGYVTALKFAEVREVPRIIERLGSDRQLVLQQLRELAQADDTKPEGGRSRLNAALALLPEDPFQAPYLVVRLLQENLALRPDELLVISRALLENDHADALLPQLWALLKFNELDDIQFRAAGALALFAPKDPRWPDLASSVAAKLVRENPLLISAWSEVFNSIHEPLAQPLRVIYWDRSRPEQRAIAASLLFDFAAQPANLHATEDLIELIGEADPPLFQRVLDAIPNRAKAVQLLAAKLVKRDRFDEVPARRQGQVATALARLGGSAAGLAIATAQ